jgi:hypothetical protein
MGMFGKERIELTPGEAGTQADIARRYEPQIVCDIRHYLSWWWLLRERMWVEPYEIPACLVDRT